MPRPYTYAGRNTTKNVGGRIYGIFESKMFGINISAIYKYVFET